MAATKTNIPGVFAIHPGADQGASATGPLDQANPDQPAAQPVQTYDQQQQQQAPAVPESRRELVRELTASVKKAREFWRMVFERIREDIDFAGGDQWDDAEDKMANQGSDRYQVNFIQRELNQQVAFVFAKNPTVECKRKHRLEYAVWDGSEQQLAQAVARVGAAMQTPNAAVVAGEHPVLAQTNLGPDPNDIAIIKDYQTGLQRKKLYDRIATTLEIVFKHQLDEQDPDFETQMKALVLREKTTGAAFVTVKYRKENTSPPTASVNQTTVVERLERILQLAKTVNQDPAAAKDSAAAEELRLMTQVTLQSLTGGQQLDGVMEGLVFDFIPTTSLIVDPKCRNLFGFVGADWIAQELYLTPEQIMEQWQIDVTGRTGDTSLGAANPYDKMAESATQAPQLKTSSTGNEKPNQAGTWKEGNQCCVWIMQNKRDQMQYVICDGYENFLEEPTMPWPAVKGFWHTVAFKLTPIEVEENKPTTGVTIYGTSAVHLMRPMQQEMNRSQEGLREHRVANRPGYITRKGTFSDNDKMNIAQRAPHDVIPLDNVRPDEALDKVLAPIPVTEINPSLYRYDAVLQQVGLVTGSQQANMGQQGPEEKATGQAIAEQSRVQSANSEADNLDKGLSEVSRIGGEMLLTVMSPQTVAAIAGPGGAWPTDPKVRAAVKQSLFLAIKAGSSGRPNKALEIANLEKMMPYMIQLAQLLGLPLDDIVQYAAKVLEFDFDLDEWLAKRAQVPPAAGAPGQPVAAAPGVPVQGAPAPVPNSGTPPTAQPMPTPGQGPMTMPAAAQRMLPAADKVGA